MIWHKRLKFLAGSFVLLSLADLVLSIVVLDMGAIEANPTLQAIIHSPIGWLYKIAASVAVMLALLAYARTNENNQVANPRRILIGLNVGMVAVLGVLAWTWWSLR